MNEEQLKKIREGGVKDLKGSNLEGANLCRADLYGSDLEGANLEGATYDITQVLKASWGKVSDKLCLWLMRLDCEACFDGTVKFKEWVQGGGLVRVAHFKEKKELWKPGRAPKLTTIWKQLAKEKEVKI